MHTNWLLMKNNLKAFSLLEVITVIVIISIMAGFAYPSYVKTILKARERDAVSQLLAIRSASKYYHAQTGSFWSATTTDTDQINSNLNISVTTHGDMTFQYTSPIGGDSNKFEALAIWDDPGSSTRDFEALITEDSLTPNDLSDANPCCYDGACPSLADC